MLDVRRSPELQAAILALRGADRDVRLQVNAEARRGANEDWRNAINLRVRTTAERQVIARGARVAVGSDRVTLMAATSGRVLSGGLEPYSQWPGFEFGMRTRRSVVRGRSPKGTSYTFERTTGRQFRGRTKDGQIAFDAASEVGTRIVAGWVKSIVDVFRRAPFEVSN